MHPLLALPALAAALLFLRAVVRFARELNTGSTPYAAVRAAFTARYDAAFQANKSGLTIGGAPASGGMTGDAPTDGGVPAVVDQVSLFFFAGCGRVRA
jgi:hypothetical protein